MTKFRYVKISIHSGIFFGILAIVPLDEDVEDVVAVVDTISCGCHSGKVAKVSQGHMPRSM